MSDYISRDEIFSVWRSMPKPASISSLIDAINRTPAADVEPVRPMGMMRYNRIFDWQQCSVCGAVIKSTIYVSEDYNLDREIHFCTRCGAKMDLEGENG